MSEIPPEPPAATDAEELGLTPDQWMDLQYAYNSGRMEPEEGTVEDEVFRRLDADNHQDYLMRCERDRADAAYHKWAQAHPDEAAKRQAEISGRVGRAGVGMRRPARLGGRCRGRSGTGGRAVTAGDPGRLQAQAAAARRAMGLARP